MDSPRKRTHTKQEPHPLYITANQLAYIFRADMNLLSATAHHSHRPYKGDASYFTITANGQTAVNAAWSYEEPFPAMEKIAGYLAFYPDRVDKIA